MSFLNSVLSSINPSTPPVQAPEIRRVPARKPDTVGSSAGEKRKAEDELSASNKKVCKKTDQPSSAPAQTDTKSSKTAQPLKTKATEASSPYKGTSRESSTPSNAPSKNVPPKKGSFAEIMARAKQNQGPPVGKITHKPKEKISAKKEIALEKELAKKKPVKGMPVKNSPLSKNSELPIRKHVPDGKAGDKTAKLGKYQGTSRPANKPQTSNGYQGTAKPKPQSSYQGTMKSSKASVPRAYHSDSEPSRSKLQSSSKHRHREEDYDDESEGYDSEDPYTYASEDYSDMDAGFDDMEEEDEMAVRIAKREDAAAQAELDKLKREKDKKRSLVQGKATRRN